jgi:hypothetical protein
MLTPRNAIIVAGVLLVAMVAASVLGSRAAPGSQGGHQDSFGVGRDGYRGIVEVLAELGIPVERRIDPPLAMPPADATLLLIAPDPLLVRTEPMPLRQLAAWVSEGGRVVVAPDFATTTEQASLDELARKMPHFGEDILAALGMPNVRAELMLSSDVPKASPSDDRQLVVSPVAATSNGPGSPTVQQLVTLGAELPEITWGQGPNPRWVTEILDAGGRPRTLAAAFAAGRGEVVVLSDATLCSNVTLRRDHNAEWLLAVLLEGGRERVVVDEFYHGLSIRGNAWWLLTKPAFAALTVLGLLLLGVWTWRHGVLLGPPLAEVSPSRRSLGEYIAAMSRFFLRGRDSERFILEQLRAGVWRRLALATGLPSAADDVNLLVSRLERKDPAWGMRARHALQLSAAALQASQRDPAVRLRAMQLLSAAASPQVAEAVDARWDGTPRR